MKCPCCGAEIRYVGRSHVGARRTDHITSHLASEEEEASGRKDKQRLLCLLFVEQHPGLTSGEYAEIHGVNRHMPARRLPDVRSDGYVRNGVSRRCRVSGRKCMTWYPTAVAGREQIGLPL
ncbi:MAG: winged helix-turn-helix domain-containing protein [Candidatus Eisenbacteria sp.]|nr:winged helix-turn-helix domain-containing protein [Candidatus Eisenbacteria bacterium]